MMIINVVHRVRTNAKPVDAQAFRTIRASCSQCLRAFSIFVAFVVVSIGCFSASTSLRAGELVVSTDTPVLHISTSQLQQSTKVTKPVTAQGSPFLGIGRGAAPISYAIVPFRLPDDDEAAEKYASEFESDAEDYLSYGNTQKAKLCSDAAYELKRGVLTRRDLHDSDTQQKIRSYVETCLHTLHDANEWWSQEILKYLGVLSTSDDGRIFCTATVIGPRHVLTARHCLFADSDRSCRATKLRAVTDVVFSRVVESRKTHQVTQFRHPETVPKDNHAIFDCADRTTDFAVVELARNVVENSPPFMPENRNLGRGDQLLVVGYNAYYDYVLSRGLREPGNSGTDWTRSMVYDQDPICSVFAIHNGACIINACKTSPGMSGSPLFKVSQTENCDGMEIVRSGSVNAESECLILTGVHSSGMFSKSPSSCDYGEYSAALSNFGITVDRMNLEATIR